MNGMTAATPAMVCYSVSPNAYLTEHAGEICGLYDGFYFVCGNWDDGVETNLGMGSARPEWFAQAKENVAALREVGVTENLLGVHFSQNGAWPSTETLLSGEYTAKMRRHFAALGRAAREAGFRGVSIDVEYPYPRYELDHPIYTYEGYTPGDLMAAAFRQGREAMRGLLDEFPEAVVFLLPGTIRSRPIERQFMLGLLEEMAERDAPGGYHLATEYAYSLHDPVTQAAIPRFEDCGMGELLSERTFGYWRRRCTMAPGVWPLHMVETGGEDYPVRPWAEELAELRQQMRILRSLAKRYIWSYSGHAVWYVPREGVEVPGRRAPDFPGAVEAISGWHEILRERKAYAELPDADRRMLRLFDAVRQFDEGVRDADGLCDAFGTPGRWWVLGPLGNPHTHPARAAGEALSQPVSPMRVYYGRDGAVRWFPYAVHDPRGVVELRRIFGYIATDDASVHMVCWVHSDREHDAVMHIGWDDGIIVRLGEGIVFDRRSYPPEGHGAFYRDRYQFEEHVPVRIPAGSTRLAVTDLNSHGVWQFNIRFTDGDGYPFPDVRFRLEK